ncbi:transport-associated [Desulfofarcimen acetoxidans DSM 771]|jgi:hyperosmotically inducible protein|uniref:Transport-associated n=1 Tax=Desulfofarcimen acetoxidans (strain ATCC 49208 / DSM 771 / KCTC 5769 / VKM B-1644 / 5575) TaxID=485916 RepID=C8VW25_DESAS|nr:BON domain-containing protein [Desulfofarcimen acetoxidans]ACV64312.1 transport-associated [Desulfofarcimen acetoxidans DSM 771]
MTRKIPDRELQQKVRGFLENDLNLRRYELKANVNKGEVSVIGIVDTLSEKEYLNRHLAGLQGIQRINNGVTVSTDGAIDDEDVAFEVAEELGSDPQVNMLHVGVKSVNGTVFLQGRVDSEEEKDAAVKAASRARGVTNVVSQLKRKDHDLTLKEIFHSQVNNDREDSNKEDFIVE